MIGGKSGRAGDNRFADSGAIHKTAVANARAGIAIKMLVRGATRLALLGIAIKIRRRATNIFSWRAWTGKRLYPARLGRAGTERQRRIRTAEDRRSGEN